MTNGADEGAQDLIGDSGCLLLLCMGTDFFDSGFLMGGGGRRGLKSSRMLLGLEVLTTDMYLQRNLWFRMVTFPEPSTLIAHWLS